MPARAVPVALAETRRWSTRLISLPAQHPRRRRRRTILPAFSLILLSSQRDRIDHEQLTERIDAVSSSATNDHLFTYQSTQSDSITPLSPSPSFYTLTLPKLTYSLTRMSPIPTELHDLKRAEVQKLCKTLGIKGANQKTDVLIGLILQHNNSPKENVFPMDNGADVRPNSRLLQPTASSRAKQASQKNLLRNRIVSERRPSPYKVRMKRGLPRPLDTVTTIHREDLTTVDSTPDEGDHDCDEMGEDDEEATEKRADTDPVSSPSCGCPAIAQLSQLSADVPSIWNVLVELTTRIHKLPMKEEITLDIERFYDALARTDAAIRLVDSKIELSDRKRVQAEEEVIRKADAEAMVDRLVESRLKRMERSFDDRLRAVEDRLMARLSETGAPCPAPVNLLDMSIDQRSRTEQVRSELDKKALEKTSDVAAASCSPNKEETLIVSTPSSVSPLKRSFSVFSPPIPSDMAELEDRQQKRSRVASLAVSGPPASVVEGLFMDLPGRSSESDMSLFGSITGSPTATSATPAVASSCLTTLATSAEVVSTEACPVPSLETGRPIVEPVQPFARLPSTFRSCSLKPKKKNDDAGAEEAPSTLPPVSTSTPKHIAILRHATGSTDGPSEGALSVPATSTPFGRQTVQSLLPPVPVGAPFWISPIAPARQAHRYRPKPKQGLPTGGPLAPTGAHNVQRGSSQNLATDPPTPAGLKTMFGTEHDTFGQAFGDEMTPWML